MLRLKLMTGALIAVSFTSPAAASECGDAINQYRGARSEIADALRRYSNCLTSDTSGREDCSYEFRRLRNAQNDYESSVSQVQSYCRD